MKKKEKIILFTVKANLTHFQAILGSFMERIIAVLKHYIYTHAFSFINLLTPPVIINRDSSSCSCTVYVICGIIKHTDSFSSVCY